MTDRGEYGMELDAWSRAREATARILGARGRSPQQETPDWGQERDGGAPTGPSSSGTGERTGPRPQGSTRGVLRRPPLPGATDRDGRGQLGPSLWAEAPPAPSASTAGLDVAAAEGDAPPSSVASSDAARRVVAELEGRV